MWILLLPLQPPRPARPTGPPTPARRCVVARDSARALGAQAAGLSAAAVGPGEERGAEVSQAEVGVTWNENGARRSGLVVRGGVWGGGTGGRRKGLKERKERKERKGNTDDG